jgi:hypothetical protein
MTKNNGEIVRLKNVFLRNDGKVVRSCSVPLNAKFTYRNGRLLFAHYKNAFRTRRSTVIDDLNEISQYEFIEEFDEFVVDRSRKFYLNDNNVAIPKRDGVTLSDLNKSVKRSSRRSTQNFYNLACSNTWKYFCTFTFKDSEVRTSKDNVLHGWKMFCQFMRRKYPGFIALCIYEFFSDRDNGYHYHALIGNCDLNLEPAVNFHTKDLIYSKDKQVFNVKDWKCGFSTAVEITNGSDNTKLVNYMFTAYLNKDKSAVPYGCKSFFLVVI